MLKYFKNAYVITGLIVVIAITTLVIYTTYGVKKINIKIDKDFATYISRYTSGVVSNKTTIKIVFIADLPSQITNNKDLQNLFEFSPKISGTVRWVNASTIEFIPQNTLPSGTLFTGKFFLKKLLKVPEKLGEFPLVFQTQTQVITTELNAFRPLNPSDKKLNFCAITFKTTDIMNYDQLESMVVVQGQKPKMTWQHEHDGKTHNLYLDPLERTNQSQEINIDFKNKNLTGYKLMPLTFTIPALSTFSIMKVYHQIVDDNNTISYLFSDPLLESQDLEGLISTSKHISFNFQRRSNKLTINSLYNYEGAISFEISAALSSVDNQKLSSTLKHEFYFPQKSPQIEFIGKGNIVPTNGTSLNIAFKAIKVKAVNLKIVKLFENNLPYFLQSHEISNTYNLKSFGKLVYKGEMPLIVKNAIDYNQWTNFSVDISKFITLEPGALYSVIMSFSKSQTIFNCSDSLSSESTSSSFADQKIAYDATSEDNSYGDFNDDGYENYDDDNYYEHRNNPCYDAFYNSYNEKVFIQKNFFVSNFGIIAKGSSLNTYHIAISNLKTTDPEKNVDIKIYDFQNQLIQTVKTNHEGLAQVALDRKPFYLLAFKDDQRGYLKLNDANALSLSMFDISGEEIVEGFKGFIYAERGVWRPGDSIYLQFILQDKLKKIPEQYPVIMSLYTPLDKLYKKQVLFEGYKNHYDFRTATDENSPTGNWTVKIKLGNQVFTKIIKIETIKPNRIKMVFDKPQNILSVQHKSLSFNAHWLQGPPASNLKANIEGSLSENLNYFNKYPHYIFNDPSKKKTRINKTLYNNSLNNEGAAQFDLDIDIHPDEASGILNLKTVCRVFEKSGDFSEEVHRFDYAPFNNYVGFLLPNTSFWGAELKSDKENIIPIVLLDTKGLPASSDQVKIEVFDINANWWWSWRDEKSIQDFDQNVIQSLCFSDVTQIKNGKLMYKLQFPKKSYGRKFIKITDLVGGHSTGGFCWVDYDGWNWEANNNNPAAEIFDFSVEKNTYQVGDNIKINIPEIKDGKILVSLENGTDIIDKFWVDGQKGLKQISIKATENMTPNVYIHLSYIQPYQNVKNDLPIRLYGIQAVTIENKHSHLNPIITMADHIEPLKNVTIKIAEKNKQAMVYTIAVVEEGLLNITNFKTPNPWTVFYSKEALKIKTWDMYNNVLGALAGEMHPLLVTGGDEYNVSDLNSNKNRFKPVTKFFGPFYLKEGANATHQFTMPNYIGAVRTMVIAHNQDAYGSAEKSSTVKSPLMVLTTLPRTLGPNETFELPVTIFTDNLKSNQVSLKIFSKKNYCQFIEGQTKTIELNKQNETIVTFQVKTLDKIGEDDIIVSAEVLGNKANNSTTIKIKPRSAIVKTTLDTVVKAGQTLHLNYDKLGLEGTNAAALNLTTIYNFRLSERLDFLIKYPYGCLEQTVSSIFPQLYLPQISDLNDIDKQSIEFNVKAGIEKLKQFQNTSGAFSYWAESESYINEWANIYAGNFLIEAQNLGYDIPETMLKSWLNYEVLQANNWSLNFQNSSLMSIADYDLLQAQRLYCLALGKSTAWGAMNRLKEKSSLDGTVLRRLAAAYAISGKADVAENLWDLSFKSNANDYFRYSFGSPERNMALDLESSLVLNRKQISLSLLKAISNNLKSDIWYSTQTTAYSLLSITKALKKFFGSQKSGQTQCTIAYNGVTQNVELVSAFKTLNIPLTQNRNQISLTNSGKTDMYLSLFNEGIPLMNTSVKPDQNIVLTENYMDMKGNKIDIHHLKQGTDFMVEIKVKHPGLLADYDNLALVQMFPSGWEIRNTRIHDNETLQNAQDITYQNFLDDAVHSFFNLPQGKSITIKILLHASYIGEFMLPSTICEAMYRHDIYAATPYSKVIVTK